MDQSEAPILQALQEYHHQDTLPFTTPAHKVGRGVDTYTTGVLGRSAFLSDVSELAGVDDRHLSKGVRTKAEQLAAQLYGADQCLFSTNGSSLSMHTALLTVAGSDEAAGLIAAEMISPYPPGIPVIAPGERFSGPIVDYLRAVQQLKFAIPDATDPSLQAVRVVA